MGDFTQAAYVTVMGMGMVFVALGGLMLIISGLQRIFREPRARAAPALMDSSAPLAVAAVGEEDVPEEVVAAITVALAALKQRRQPPKPPETSVITLTPGTSAWRASGRLR